MKNDAILVFKLIFLIFLFLILLDFIPVKFAVKIDGELQSNVYVCEAITATEGQWKVLKSGNEDIEKHTVLWDISGETPFKTLNSEIYSTEWLKGNQCVVKGQLKQEKTPISENGYILYAEKCDVAYPIKRYFRTYAPKSYLTIYDYDWGYFVKKWFNMEN